MELRTQRDEIRDSISIYKNYPITMEPFASLGKLDPETVTKWTRCSERLPPAGVDVIVLREGYSTIAGTWDANGPDNMGEWITAACTYEVEGSDRWQEIVPPR